MRYLTVDELPPRPDPATGLPRPPQAPGFLHMVAEADREHDPAMAPDPPPGQSPVLVWHQETERGSRKTGILMLAIMAGIMVFANGTKLLTDPKYWGVWVALGVGGLWIYLISRGLRFSAGADWLAKRGHWVRLYELKKITAHGYPYWGAGMCLQDTGGRKVRVRLVDLSSDRLLWDLTYNGILHSVIAGGAKTNGTLRRTLALPEPAPPTGSDPGRQP